MEPVGQLKELPYYKGYYIDEAQPQQLFTHWRLVWKENGATGIEYIAKMIKTANMVWVEPGVAKHHGVRRDEYKVAHRRKWKAVSRLDLLTEGARGVRPRFVATYLDGDEANERPENLAWCALAHHRRIMRGDAVQKSKLSPRQVKEILKRLSGGYKAADLAREYGVTPATISQIKHGVRK